MESCRYKKGVPTEFMVNLEMELSQFYQSLAEIFTGTFLEREFWLTALYLNPNETYYREVMRCGAQNIRNYLLKRYKEKGKNFNSITTPEWFKAKFELLSSTVDVKYIAKLTNESTLYNDYENINNALKSLGLPAATTRDLLSSIFIPRNKIYSWAINWNSLRNRCARLCKNPSIKNNFIAFNMADANSRLKYINIDYSKYKNRPQLNYGTIEAGYEKHLVLSYYPNINDTYDENSAYYFHTCDDEDDEEFHGIMDDSYDYEDFNISKQLKEGNYFYLNIYKILTCFIFVYVH